MVLKAFPAEDLRVYFIWIDILEGDNADSAAVAAQRFDDPKLQQFHDDGQLGRGFAAAFGYPDVTAWDCYLIFPAEAEWTEKPPLPQSFAHQLAAAPPEFQSSYRSGAELDEYLRETVAEMLAGP